MAEAVDKKISQSGRLDTIKVVSDGEYLSSAEEFLKRAQEITGRSKRIFVKGMFSFYKQIKNHHLLPDNVECIVFLEEGKRCFCVLQRVNGLWFEGVTLQGNFFSAKDVVAVV